MHPIFLFALAGMLIAAMFVFAYRYIKAEIKYLAWQKTQANILFDDQT